MKTPDVKRKEKRAMCATDKKLFTSLEKLTKCFSYFLHTFNSLLVSFEKQTWSLKHTLDPGDLNDHQISSEQTLPFFWLSYRNVEITLHDILLGKLDEESDLSNHMLICKVSYPMGQDVDEVSTQTSTYFRDW